jgi:hypothetical protein
VHVRRSEATITITVQRRREASHDLTLPESLLAVHCDKAFDTMNYAYYRSGVHTWGVKHRPGAAEVRPSAPVTLGT